MSGIKGYIIHVKTAYDREKHMREQIKNLPFNFEFVLDGDQDEIIPEILKKYFKEGMLKGEWQGGLGAVSCTYKHFLALRDMIKNNIEFGIVFENDIFLEKNFTESVYKAIDEIKERKISNFYLSLEDSFFIFVKGSVRKKGQTVYRVYEHEYRKSHPYLISRAAGAYIVDLQAAKNIINEVDTNKCSRVSDWFFTYCASEKIIDLYYLHP
ncbi:MAG: glycosyltransferase family 25 protein, partial [Endomicrobium sp.]|nr:glycosyltransferase family 25 protein [Endomicrobium sp.]